jgi:MFS superfamily sulfate permease-like transporter
VVPITRWFPHYFRYGWATNIKFDLLAAITIAFMLIPQVRTLLT